MPQGLGGTNLMRRYRASAVAAAAPASHGAGFHGVSSGLLFNHANVANLRPSGFQSFSIAGWVNVDPGGTGGSGWIAGIGTFGTTVYEVSVDSSTLKPRMDCTDNNGSTPHAIWGSAISTGAWHLVVGEIDLAGAGTVYVSADGGNLTAGGAVGAILKTSVIDFGVGNRADAGARLDGSVARVGIWLGRLLSNSDISTLYNSGVAFSYSTLPAGLKTSLTAWWDCSEATGVTRVESVNTYNLSDSGSNVLQVTGP